MSGVLPKVYLVRHGETAWTISGQHTGRTDIPLTERGERDAQGLRARLRGLTFAKVLTSPLQRARRTGELAGFAECAEADPDLMEWDYGAYEGRRTSDIRAERPGWRLFEDGCPGGESVEAVGAMAPTLDQGSFTDTRGKHDWFGCDSGLGPLVAQTLEVRRWVAQCEIVIDLVFPLNKFRKV